MIIALDRVGLADAPRVGRKAAVLGELAAAGFAVPAGVVLPAAVGPAGDPSEDPSEDPSVPDVAALIGPGPYAVRSSGLAEDGAGASYAGLYETVLEVAAADLPTAVRRCRASATGDRVRVYAAARAAAGAGAAAGLAVLIQRMVPADAAGVAFTADPVTGERDVVVVNAVRGTAEKLVSGAVAADEWVVRAGTATPRRKPHGAVDEAAVLAVAALARGVAAHLGAPQDVEWALCGGELALLQARPITALPGPGGAAGAAPVPIPVDPPDGYWERESGHAPKPWTPMQVSVFYGPRNEALRTMFETFGFLVETLEFREIGGWDYMRIVPLGGRDRPAPPGWLMPVLIRLVPAMRRRIRAAVRSVRDDVAGALVERWYDEWQPELTARIAGLRGVDPGALDDAALARHTDAARRLLAEGCRIHFLLHGALGLILSDLALLCRDRLGWTDARTFELLGGLSTVSTRPAHRLAELAGRVEDPGFAAALADYLAEYGHRALRYDIADPTVAETPELTLRLLADQIARGYDPRAEVTALTRRRADAAAAARDALGEPDERFERVLARAERAYPVREDNEFFTLSAPTALLRYAVAEHGRRLAERNRLDHRDDVFFLTLPEARDAVAGSTVDLRPLVTRRRGEHAWALRNPGPAAYGTPPGPPPPFDALPPEARSNQEALLWTVERIFESRSSSRSQAAGSGPLTGIAAAPGRYTGPVRVVPDETRFDKLRPGDVLVCPVTSPVWSVLFPTVGALVTDTGGLLSHPAIIAREYRVPAVVATGNATSLLRDGQVVTVDGDAGTIEVRG